MKKYLLLFAALLPFMASAEKVEINGIWYNLVSKTKMAEVTYKGDSYDSYDDEYSSSITLPATVTYNGVAYSVTSIGETAFFSCPSLTDITIPEGVTSIGKYAFLGCSSLISIILPEGMTSIGDYAFADCSSLTTIILPEGVTSIGSGAFEDCSSLTAITIPEGVTSIGEYAFRECSSLTSITIPESVTSIGESAFSRCSSITAITIPEDVTSIGERVFSGCSSLTAITIPESVTSIGESAFSDCNSLTDVYCYAETVPSTIADAFDGPYIDHVTLHVPASALADYKRTAPWSGFGTIVPLTDENMGVEQLTGDDRKMTIYDLTGRRVAHPTKGEIHIVGGKKVVIK